MKAEDLPKPKSAVVIEKCPDACERAYYYHDEWYSELMGEERGQWNCPYHYGVTYAAATIDGKINCKHFKRKETR